MSGSRNAPEVFAFEALATRSTAFFVFAKIQMRMSNVSNQNPVMQVSEAVQVAPTEQVVNLVAVENNQTVTTSLKVAEVFGKRHADVLRAVSNLECSEDFRERNFALIQKISDLGKGRTRKDPMYHITRDGFMFLVMGFTGKTAAKWKEAYIRAFNEMEAKLRAEQTERAIKDAVEKERIEDAEYKALLEREDREEAEVDRRVEELARKRAEEAKAEVKAKATEQTDDIVEIVGGKRVISSVTIARLTDRRHCDVMESIRRMFKHSDRPTRMFIKSERWAKKANCARAARFYYVTIGGFVLLRKYTHSISYEVHVEVMRAFGDNKGMSRQQLGLDNDTPTATPPTKARKPRAQHPAPTKPQAQTPQAQTAATMPQTPNDLMQRFVKAMGVMMGMDTNEMFNLMQKGE